MRCIALLCVSTLALAFAGSASAIDSWRLRIDGIGPVKIGMTIAQLNATLHERFGMPEDESDRGCFYLEPKAHPGVSFMMENGKLVRVDVGMRGIETRSGIQVGDSENRTHRVYGSSLTVETRAYLDEPDHFLTIKSKDGRYALRFETAHRKIESFYAGTAQAVSYIEGCS
jgi:hypothetical protein